MSYAYSEKSLLRKLARVFMVAFLTFGSMFNGSDVFAHGGEDHGDQKPKVESSSPGMVARTARLGDIEVMLKHSIIEPDTAVSGRLFISKFSTNEPVDVADPVIEIESAVGSVAKGEVQKTDIAGTYSFTLPALPEGSYTIRVVAAPGGKTGTASFSVVEVSHQVPAGASSGMSWAGIAVASVLFLVAAALFVGLVFLALRILRSKPLYEEAVSA